jgi:hypothetical protein
MGTNYNVDANMLRQLETPPATRTYSPVSHYNLLNIVTAQIENAGMEVLNQRLDVNESGAQMFGSMTLSNGDDKSHFMLGFRNSTNKLISLGFCAGLSIVVCSNMMFSGDYMTFQKHDGTLTLQKVADLAKNAVYALPQQKQLMDDRLIRYENQEIIEPELKSITYDLIQNRVFPANQFHNFHKCLDEERGSSQALSLATVHNASTRLIRNRSLMAIAQSTPLLTQITDDYSARLAA